ncbi:hypothetical protein [Serratia microhaemolytica]|uniref:hypothetical protein n=1 Tax=Serratia microhaemolytica TaxID=2675110 RepID=UPI000FDE4B87|nr:hypothetical protein [Serratia microhaemolytica]
MTFRSVISAIILVSFAQDTAAFLTKKEVQSLAKTKIVEVEKIEDNPGVYFQSYKFAKDPDFTVQTKARYFTVSWNEYHDDPQYDKVNAKNRQLAEEVVENLIGSSRFVRAITSGGVVKRIQEGRYIVSGSCSGNSFCLLSFDKAW